MLIFGIPMGAKAATLFEFKIKAAKPEDKDYVLSDGSGLHMQIGTNSSKFLSVNYPHPITKKRITLHKCMRLSQRLLAPMILSRVQY